MRPLVLLFCSIVAFSQVDGPLDFKVEHACPDSKQACPVALCPLDRFSVLLLSILRTRRKHMMKEQSR